MKIIKTKAPIAIDQLKEYFSDNTIRYEIDYTESTLKGGKLLTYLSNLDLPCDVTFSTVEESQELLKEYFNSPLLVNITSLEQLAMDVLFEHKGLEDNGFSNFIAENAEIINQWQVALDSLTLYNMYIVESEEMKDYVKSFPIDETDSTRGVNFVSLLKHEEFYSYYSRIDKSKLKFFKTYFESYMFKGKSLYNFWAIDQNPLFLITWGVASGTVAPEKTEMVV